MTPENVTALINAVPLILAALAAFITASVGAFLAVWSRLAELKKNTDGMHSELIRLTKLEERVNAGQLASNVDAAAARVVATAGKAASALAAGSPLPSIDPYDQTIKVERGALLEGSVVDIEGATIHKAK